MLLVRTWQKPQSRIPHHSLSLKMFEYTPSPKIHKPVILDFWGRVYPGEAGFMHHFVSAYGNNVNRKPHFKILHDSLTILKDWKRCHTRTAMKLNPSCKFPLTWPQKNGHHFQIVWYFHMRYFAWCSLEHCRNEMWTQVPQAYNLFQKQHNI